MTTDTRPTKKLPADFSNIISDHSLEAIFIFDSNLQCLDANEAASKLFQYRAEDFIGTDSSFLVAPEHRHIAVENARSKTTAPYILELIKKDGTHFEGLIQGTNVSIPGQQLRITTVRDLTGLNELEKERQRSSDKLASIYANQLAGIVVIDGSRTIKQANDKAAKIIGFDRADEIVGIPLKTLHISQEKQEKFDRLYSHGEMPALDLTEEFPFYKKDGSKAWLKVSGSPISKANPPDLSKGIVWIIHDISDLKATEVKLEQAFRELEVIFNYANVAIVFTIGDRIIKKTNQTFVDMFGGESPEDWVGRSAKDFHTDDESFYKFGAQYHAILTSNDVREVDYQFKSRDGKILWATISGRALDTTQPADLTKGVIWVLKDITQRKVMEQELIRLSREDALTGASNRRHFFEQANREINIMRRYGKTLSLLMLDIDFFKQINDQYGHSVGDQALICFAKLCKKSVREEDLVGRLGGEEFAILLLDTSLNRAEEVAWRILKDLGKQTCDLPMKSMTASIGAVQVSHSETLEQALARADQLLYKAKHNGKNRVET